MFDPDPQLDTLLQSLLHPGLKKIDPGLDRVLRLLEALGSPHQHLPPVVHIAGTNGKGSTLAYLRAMLEAAGYRCHVYTSPHLVHFAERIVVAGEQISHSALIPLLQEVQALQVTHPATFFEATTAAAFLAFARTPADIVLLETGMGGRLDATNVIDQPLLTIITAIGMDHTEFLGDSIKAIAAEKAAIMKHSRPCITAMQSETAVLSIFRQWATNTGTPLLAAPSEWDYRQTAQNQWVLQWDGAEKSFPMPCLPGSHQLHNAATAIMASHKLDGFVLTEHHQIAGLQNAHWPARIQKLENTRWNALLHPNQQLYLDGGHNPMAASILAQWLEYQPKPATIILGMLNAKDAEGFMRHLLPYATQLCTVAIPGESDSYAAEELSQIARKLGGQAVPCQNLGEALTAARQVENPTVLICGSLYLAGWVLHYKN
jgi:dihydrofolate synthase / folylpolyglutamate synthase